MNSGYRESLDGIRIYEQLVPRRWRRTTLLTFCLTNIYAPEEQRDCQNKITRKRFAGSQNSKIITSKRKRWKSAVDTSILFPTNFVDRVE